jgi:DNA polymerase-3 subunit epsilon
MRQIVLDTETTGLDVTEGHRLIEIGAVELINRRPTGQHFHRYLNPQREIDPGAIEVHGLTLERLAGEPVFAEVAQDFLTFIADSDLIIHNAPFDLGFLNAELALWDAEKGALQSRCTVIDTLMLARARHPGQRNSLDALCKRYDIDNSARTLHGALLDARILADVYLAMTGGQSALALDSAGAPSGRDRAARATETRPSTPRARERREPLLVIEPTAEEQDAHARMLDTMRGSCTVPVFDNP